MSISLFIARIIGVCYIVFGLGMLFNRKAYLKVMEDFSKNAALVFYGGFLALVVGLLIALSHNLWVKDWRVMITAFGWAGIVKGIWLSVFPATVDKFMQGYSRNKGLFVFHSVLALVLGAVFAWFGFFR